MRAHVLVILLVVVANVGCARGAALTVPVPADGEDAVAAIRTALERAAREGITEIRFEPGRYHLYRERASEKFLHVANHDDGLRRIGFSLIGCSNLRIDCNGATFIAHGQMIPFHVEDSRGVTLANLTLDWAEPFFLQARVTACDPAGDTFEIETLPECRARWTAGQVLFGEGDRRNHEGWWQNIEVSYWVDPVTRAAARVQPTVALWNARLGVAARAEDLGAGRFRLIHAATPLPEVGSVLTSKGNREDNRVSPAIHLLRSADLRLENITVHHAGGMGVIAERCENVVVERCRVALPPDSGRLVTTTADATHFVLCRGEVRVEDCLFENMLDDAINVHGVYARIARVLGPCEVELRLVQFQQLGVDFVMAGDVLRFAERESLLAYGERTVAAVQRPNAERIVVELTEPVDGWIRPDSCVDNVSWQPRLVFRHNVVRNNRARAVLVTTGATALIEGNRFERSSMSSLLVDGDAVYWHESGPVSDLAIEGNMFIGHHASAPLVRIRPAPSAEKCTLPPYHRNIRIENNAFEVAHPLVLEAARVGGLTFRDNRIEPLPGADCGTGAVIVLTAGEDIVVADNVADLGNAGGIRADGTVVRLEIENNRGLKLATEK